MTLLRGFEKPEKYRGGYVAIGNFDGVHRGHQSMIAQLTKRAAAANVPAVVLTFDPHPIMLLKPEVVPPRLSTLKTKAELLIGYGVDCVIAYPTNTVLLNLTPEQFFQQIVLDELQAKGMVEGPNFYFGKNRSGNTDTLRTLCEQHGLTLDIATAYEWEGKHVSSSAIRKRLSQGEFQRAVEKLGHPYCLTGKVTQGEGRGRHLGFPTANLTGITTLLPQEGVYAGYSLLEGKRYAAAVNIGANPTFDTDEQKVEVHLLDYSGDLYDQELSVELLAHLRPVQTFKSVDELTAQIAQDLQTTRQVVASAVE